MAASRFQRFTAIVQDGGGALHLERVVSHSPQGAANAALKRVKKRAQNQWPDDKTFFMMTRDKFEITFLLHGHARQVQAEKVGANEYQASGSNPAG